MPRLFTGLELPADLAAELALMRGGLSGARWIDPHDYHITLRFIGDIDLPTACEVASSLADIRRAPIPVTLEGLDAFGGGKPRAIVAKVQPSPPLVELQSEQERLLRRLGLPPEPRKFTPTSPWRACAARPASRSRNISASAASSPGAARPSAACCARPATRAGAAPT